MINDDLYECEGCTGEFLLEELNEDNLCAECEECLNSDEAKGLTH